MHKFHVWHWITEINEHFHIFFETHLYIQKLFVFEPTHLPNLVCSWNYMPTRRLHDIRMRYGVSGPHPEPSLCESWPLVPMCVQNFMHDFVHGKSKQAEFVRKKNINPSKNNRALHREVRKADLAPPRWSGPNKWTRTLWNGYLRTHSSANDQQNLFISRTTSFTQERAVYLFYVPIQGSPWKTTQSNFTRGSDFSLRGNYVAY